MLISSGALATILGFFGVFLVLVIAREIIVRPPLGEDDSVCGRCGYGLGGLANAGACPECGQAYAPNDGRIARRTQRMIARHIGITFVTMVLMAGASIVLQLMAGGGSRVALTAVAIALPQALQAVLAVQAIRRLAPHRARILAWTGFGAVTAVLAPIYIWGPFAKVAVILDLMLRPAPAAIAAIGACGYALTIAWLATLPRKRDQ